MHSKFNFAGQSNRILAGARFAQPGFSSTGVFRSSLGKPALPPEPFFRVLANLF
jgi:hypothetical protein